MTTNQQQDQLPGESGEQKPAISAKGAARRRFGRAGLGASGVLMTLASQPAMAQAFCATASGSLSSGLQSRHASAPIPKCDGLPPESYTDTTGNAQLKSNSRRFSSMYTTSLVPLRDAKITDILDACVKGTAITTTNGNTVVTLVDKDTVQVAGHMVAGMLNLEAKLTTANDLAALKSIWNAYELGGRALKGSYKPSATVTWYSSDIVRYMKTTYSGGSVPIVASL